MTVRHAHFPNGHRLDLFATFVPAIPSSHVETLVDARQRAPLVRISARIA